MIFNIKVKGYQNGKPSTKSFCIHAGADDYNTAAQAALAEAETGIEPLSDARIESIKTTAITEHHPFSGSEAEGYSFFLFKMQSEDGCYESIVEALGFTEAASVMIDAGNDMNACLSQKELRINGYIDATSEQSRIVVSLWQAEKNRNAVGA